MCFVRLLFTPNGDAGAVGAREVAALQVCALFTRYPYIPYGNEQWTSRTTHTGDDAPFLSRKDIY